MPPRLILTLCVLIRGFDLDFVRHLHDRRTRTAGGIQGELHLHFVSNNRVAAKEIGDIAKVSGVVRLHEHPEDREVRIVECRQGSPEKALKIRLLSYGCESHATRMRAVDW